MSKSNSTEFTKNLEGQSYSDNNGEWMVLDILDYAKKNSKLQFFSIDNLAEIAFQKSPYESFDEVPGSPEFINRAMKSDLKYPIIVVRYPDGDFIADGNHRLWKARSEGLKKIRGYLLKDEDLLNIPMIYFSEKTASTTSTLLIYKDESGREFSAKDIVADGYKPKGKYKAVSLADRVNSPNFGKNKS